MHAKSMLKGLAGGVVLVALMVTNFSIFQKERLLASGAVVILELAPVDPRSLMQGDYMALNYALTQPLQQQLQAQNDACHDSGVACVPASGTVIVELDAQRRAVRAEFDHGQILRAQDVVMKYHFSEHGLNIGTRSYFFQEGHAERFAGARYGEFRVDKEGTALLTYLLDAKGKRILP